MFDIYSSDYKIVKVDVISCETCNVKYIRLVSKNKTCKKCRSSYCVHMLGEVIKLDLKDFNKLKKDGKLLLTKSLDFKYNFNFL